MGEEKKGFWGRLVEGLSKTRDNIVSGIDSIFSGFSSIDDDFYEEIEEILIMGDIGVNATESIIESLKEKVKENHIKDPAECKELLINSIKEQMDVGETAYRFETARPHPLESWRESSRTRGKRSCLRQRIPSAQRRETSCRSGQTAPVWI